MALSTFLPSVGPKPLGSTPYNLPITKTRPSSSLAFGADQTVPEESIGVHVAAGTGTDWPAAGTMDVVFQLTGAYLKTNSYPVTYGGMMTAWLDFKMNVVMGGLGLFTDIPPANTLYLGSTVDHYNFTGRVSGQVDFLPLGDTDAEITCTIENPGGLSTVIGAASLVLGYVSWP